MVRRVADRIPGGWPFAMRFWGGSELPGESDDTLIVRSPRALARVVRDRGQLGLGRAWVAGELDVEG